MAEVTTIAVDKNNDIYLDASKNLAMKENIEAVGDIILNKVRTNLGELQFNTDLGIPYFTTIFVADPNFEMWKKFVEDSALSLEFVSEITDFQMEIVNSTLKYAITIKTDFGSATING